MNLSRRNFLKGASAAGAAAAIAGLAGCSPQNHTTNESEETSQTNVSENPRESWAGTAPEISDDQVSQTVEADVVVIGLSDAGTAAVRAIVEEGASVIAVEKASAIQTMGSDISLFGGEWQKKTWAR